MCESCIDRLFSLGPAACPVCGQIVRKQQFSAQIFEDLRVEEEVNVRKRVGKLFNRKPEDFPDARAYNDYLEEFEEITFNLINKIDLEQTQARLAQFEVLNKSMIASQQQLRDQESLRQQHLDDAERQERMLRAQKVKEEQERERREREAEEKEIVAELEKGRSIEEVMAEREKRREERAKALAQREREEQQRQKLFEERLHTTSTSSRAVKMSQDEILYARQVASSDFDGAFALIDDGAQWAPARPAPASLGGLGPGDGYMDPWLKAEQVSKSAVAQYRAGGYDWQHQVWQRGLNALCDSLALRPIP
ncbi:TFIIH/NER complex subunit [Malassezia pachydermatis]